MNLGSLLTALTFGGKSAIKSTVVCFAGLLAYSFMVADKVVYLPSALTGVALVSVALGGFKGGMSAETLGWVHGFVVAVSYSLCAMLIRLLMFPSTGFGETVFLQVSGILFAGSIAGIAGINAKFMLRKKRRYISY